MSSISSIGSSYSSTMMQGMHGMHGMKRPDPSEMANDLFAKLDTSGQGYIEKSDLQNALDQAASKVNAAGGSTDADELFSQFDSDGDGKITKQEFTDSVKKLAEELDQQFQNARMQGAMPPMGGAGGMPPGPPPGMGEDQGLTQEELASAAEKVGTVDGTLSSMLSDIAENFEAADTNGDGKVTMKETIAYQQSQTETEADASSSSSSIGAQSEEAKIMMQIMKLAQAYGVGTGPTGFSSLLASA